MILREERDPAFWETVASHPSVRPCLFGVDPAAFAAAAVAEPCLPLAAPHGGFVFMPRDACGRAVEMHSLFTPDGWGREVYRAAHEAAARILTVHDLVITYEQIGAPRTRPPRSLGFELAGDAWPMFGAQWRTWTLSALAWRRSKCPPLLLSEPSPPAR